MEDLCPVPPLIFPFILLNVFDACVGHEASWRNVKGTNRAVNATGLIEEMTSPTLTICAYNCLEKGSCVGYNYNRHDLRCELILFGDDEVLIEENQLGWELWLRKEIPPQCISPNTVNLNEFWRNDYNYTAGGTLSKSDWERLISGMTWFRFTGDGGNLMKNTCPHSNSCGSTSGAYYSTSPLPENLYETVEIVFSESIGSSDCDNNRGADKGRATRCSMDRGGVVYTFDVWRDSGTVCGMD